MDQNRWIPYRAGLLNYWYYDEAEFYFSDGRLLLNGDNGSGKSVTMQSLVTVLLDGVKRADRLDSFGSRSRTMDDYLLGEKELSDYDERTGYLFLEYKRENSDQFITTGIGLHARRGSSKVDFWGFLLQNGRRIGHDTFLYHTTKDPETGDTQRIPLTKRELENTIGLDGRVTSEQREYMAMVNQYVFGYADIGKFEELMQLLIQLRSPKLSRDFKPSVIYEILNASLPTLSEDDLRPLAETLENMEKTRLAIEQLKREKSAFTAICKAYTAYNTAVLAERALAAEECKSIMNRTEKLYSEKKEELESTIELIDSCTRKQSELNIERSALEAEEKSLQEHEAYKAAAEKNQTEIELEKILNEKNNKEKALFEKRRRELMLNEKINENKQSLSMLEEQAEDILESLTELAEQADFSAHASMKEFFNISGRDTEDHMTLWLEERKTHEKKLWRLHDKLTHYEQAANKAEQIRQELGEEARHLDELLHEREKFVDLLDKEREQLIKAFYEWKSQWSSIVTFDREQEIEMSESIRGLYIDKKWIDVDILLSSVVGEQRRSLDTAIGQVRLNIQRHSNNVAAAQEDLKNLRETKEAEPELAEAYAKARQSLRDKDIPFLPFYEATEYRSHVEPAQRERLESALLEAGLLNSLILKSNAASSDLPDEMRGSVLIAGEPVLLAESMLDYLEPVPGDSGIEAGRIAEVLASIAVTEELYTSDSKISVNPTVGGYTLGNLSGRSAERDGALFIGRQARETYRRKQIIEKEQEISQLEEALSSARLEESELIEETKRLLQAQQSFPSHETIEGIHDNLISKEREIDKQEQLVEKKSVLKKNLELSLAEDRNTILSERGETLLTFSSAAYAEAIQKLSAYDGELHNLKLVQSKYSSTEAQLNVYCADVEDTAVEVNELNAEVIDKEIASAKLIKKIEVLEKQLKEMDAPSIEARIAEIIARLGAIPSELDTISKKLGGAEHQSKSLAEELTHLNRRSELYHILHEKWQDLVKLEEHRGFPTTESHTLQELMRSRKKNRESVTLHTLAQRVENQYAQHRDEIAEFRFSLKEISDDIGEMPEFSEEDKELFIPRWDTLRDYAIRQTALTETTGKPLSPYEQLRELNAHLDEQENLLSEQDKKIYQEIILNSIGRTISEKIYGAEDWIKKMNSLMAKSETSSALRFRLEWKPLSGDDDKELDTSELVDLLHSDPGLMREDDMKRLEEHFSTRIKRAREAAEATDKDTMAYEASVQEQLDYRKWFKFHLYYDKGEQIQRRELTDKAFFRLSGGEKAMAMYVPLFSAAYSRYLDAGPDSPKLITLDEAFAGVDENNMRDMFRLVEQMGFSYIMNSQAVRGDYDVVPSLNIYKLLRPLNANCVSLVHSHWNGKTLTTITDEKETL